MSGSDRPTKTDSAWYDDDDALMAAMQRNLARRILAPTVTGYDDLREIGRGGQGVVYRATQRSTRRLVAIKILRDPTGLDDPGRRRFEREIDLVASLRHPGIVTVFDGGVSADGRPYLVMELVEGRALDGHPAVLEFRRAEDARERERLLPTIVTIFRAMAEALAHAHRKGVIHRDLKPGNVRVREDGTPLILDFGLAKSLDHPGGGPTMTAEGGFLGSVPWASPEQAGGRIGEVDTRSDVYSMGVMMWQTLTGRFPYDVSTDLRTALSSIAEVEAQRLGAALPGISEDLETILQRCMAKAPERRYQSATELERDLGHWLAGDPIEARRDSAWYALRAGARRYRRAAILAGCGALLLLGFLVVAIALYRTARDQRDAASRARDRSERTLELLLGTIRTIDVDKEGPSARVVDLVDRMGLSLDSALADDLEGRIRMRAALADVLEKLASYDRAAAETERVIEELRKERGEDHDDVLNARANLCRIRHRQGRTAEILDEMGTILATFRRRDGESSSGALETASNLGQMLRMLGRLDEAEALWRDVDARLEPGESPLRLTIDEDLAGLARLQGRPDEAIRRQRSVLERRRLTLGEEHSDTLSSAGSLAVMLNEAGHPEEAEGILRETLAASERRLGPDHPWTIDVVDSLAKNVQDQGDLDAARDLMKRSLDARTRLYGERNPKTLATMNNWASLMAMRGQLEDALEMHRKIIAVRKEILGADALDTLISQNNLGTTLMNLDRLTEAEEAFREAVAGADRSLGEDHWIDAVFRMMLGRSLSAQGRHDEAEPILLAAEARLREKLGRDHAHTRTARAALVRLYEACGRPEAAAPFREPPPP